MKAWIVRLFPSKLSSNGILLTSVLLLAPLIINFAKISFAAYELPLTDFGRFSLYVGLSSAFVYLLNSGLYEGHLKYFSVLLLEKRSRRLGSLQVRAEFISFGLLMMAIFITLMCLSAIDFPESTFVLATVLASHVQSHSNLITAHARVTNDLLRVGFILSLRSLLSTILFICLITYGEIEVAKAYLYENITMILIFKVYLLFRIRFWHMIKVFNVLSVIKNGAWQCYASSLRSFYLALERFFASLILPPVVMGEYARLMILYQVMVVGGGLISQFLQQKILIDALSRGVKVAGIQLLKYQGAVISLAAVIILFLFVIFSDFFIHYAALLLGPDVALWGCGVVLLAGLISGTSLIDSLALGSPKGFAFFRIQILSGFLWIALFGMCYVFLNSWSLNYQAFSFLILTLILIFGNIRFVLIH